MDIAGQLEAVLLRLAFLLLLYQDLREVRKTLKKHCVFGAYIFQMDQSDRKKYFRKSHLI